MGWSFVKYLLWTLLLIVQIHEHRVCLEEERMGLLELKTFLKSNVNHTNHLFPSWVNDVRSECCGWERVTCNDIIGHVIKLSFSSIINRSYYNRWLLNVSLLQPFKELRNLDLFANGILGWLENEGMWAHAFIFRHFNGPNGLFSLLSRILPSTAYVLLIYL